MKKLISAIDIGTWKIRLLVCEKKGENLEAVFFSEESSEGVRRGIVIEPMKVSQVLEKILFRAKEKLKTNISSANVNLGGTHLFSLPSRGLVSVSRADQIISEEDVQRVLNEAKAINIGYNKEIFDVIPKEFILDGEKGIKNPVGLKATKLEVDALVLGCFSPYLENLKEALLNSGLENLNLIPSPLAAAKAVLKEKQKELGVCVLDIGAGTSSMAVFKEGEIVDLKSLPIGSQDITNKIAIDLKIDPEIAERIKIEYGTLLKEKNERQKVDIGEKKPLVFSQKFLTKIILAKYNEIFDLANKELKKISEQRNLPTGIVLTGGGSKIPGILELARAKFQLHCRVGRPKGILNLDDDPSLSVLAGLILTGLDLEEREKREAKGGIFSKIKKLFRVFLP